MANKQNMVYLDNAATTPLSPSAMKAMIPWLGSRFGNPSSIYKFGRDAKRAVENARKQVARAINAEPDEIYFTSGGSEADNWAMNSFTTKTGNYILTSEIEHHAITKSISARDDIGLLTLGTNRNGTVIVPGIKEADHIIFKYYPAVCSLMLLNNELGVTQPVEEFREAFKRDGILIHTDAVQAVGHIPVDVKALGVDMLSMSAHKFNGPKGVGALYIKKGVKVRSYINGGAQEHGMRASTENVAGIVGMGQAITEAVSHMDERHDHIIKLKNKFLDCCAHENIHVVENVPFNESGILSLRFPGYDSESLLLTLDNFDVCVSAGSACNSESIEPSHVLKAIGLSDDEARNTLRFSFGYQNTLDEVLYTVCALKSSLDFVKGGAGW